jgi:multiple sugar transport system permease protein
MNNAKNFDEKPIIKRESKNRIKVEFDDRTPFWERVKLKLLSGFFIKNVVWYLFRLVLLVGIAYIVLYPFFSKIMGSFMAPEDFIDATVILIPKNWTLDMYKYIFLELDYMTGFLNTMMLAGSTAVLQTFTCATIAYGLAKFKFKGGKYIFLAVILTMVIPHPTIQGAMFRYFQRFDILGIFRLLAGGGIGIGDFTFTNEFFQSINFAPHDIDKFGNAVYTSLWSNNGLNLNNSYWPLVIMSITGLGFKNGLYIFLLRQFFMGVPNELEESAYMDGSGTIKTFIKVIIPLSVPMLITVFLFAFSWQWNDDFYTSLFFTNQKIVLLNKIVANAPPKSLVTNYAGQSLYYAAIRNTCGLMIIAPLVIMYVFCQNFLVQGIERSGLTAD